MCVCVCVCVCLSLSLSLSLLLLFLSFPLHPWLQLTWYELAHVTGPGGAPTEPDAVRLPRFRRWMILARAKITSCDRAL